MLISENIKYETLNNDLCKVSNKILEELNIDLNLNELISTIELSSNSNIDLTNVSNKNELIDIAMIYAQSEYEKSNFNFHRYVDAFSEIFINLARKSKIGKSIDSCILVINKNECILKLSLY